MLKITSTIQDKIRFRAEEGKEELILRMLASWFSKRKDLHGVAPVITVTLPEKLFVEERILGWAGGRQQRAVKTTHNLDGMDIRDYSKGFFVVESRLFPGLLKFAKIWESIFNCYHTCSVLRIVRIASSRAKIDAADLPYFKSVNQRYSTKVFYNPETEQIVTTWEEAEAFDKLEIWGYRSGYIDYRKQLEV